jgi:hypothetical protein
MTDNMSEMVINATHSAGFVFNGHHGTGNLRVDGNIQDQPHRVWPRAAGSFFAKGSRFNQVIRSGSTGSSGHVAWWNYVGGNTIITGATFFNQMNWDAGRVSNRSGVTLQYHYRINNPVRYEGGIRLVRTQHWLTTSRAFMAGGGSQPLDPIDPTPDDDDDNG